MRTTLFSHSNVISFYANISLWMLHLIYKQRHNNDVNLSPKQNLIVFIVLYIYMLTHDTKIKKHKTTIFKLISKLISKGCA